MKKILIPLVVVLTLGACQIGWEPDVSTLGTDGHVEQAEEIFGITYDYLAAQAAAQLDSVDSSVIGSSGIISSALKPLATVTPDDSSNPVAWPTGTSEVQQTFTDYPLPNMDTTATATVHDDTVTPTIYKIVAVSQERGGGNRYIEDSLTETYYVKDGGSPGDGYWGTGATVNDDVIVDADGNTAPNYRDSIEVAFPDGSVRNEIILATLDVNDSDGIDTDLSYFDNQYGFAPLVGLTVSLASVDLSFPSSGFKPTQATSQNAAVWSSVVAYVHKLDQTFNFWFWNDSVTSPVVIGMRYYAEHYVDASDNVLGVARDANGAITGVPTGADGIMATTLAVENVLGRTDNYFSGIIPVPVGTNKVVQRTRFDLEDVDGDGTIEPGEIGAATDTDTSMRFLLKNDFWNDTIEIEKGKSGKTREVQRTDQTLNKLTDSVVPVGNWADVQAEFED